MSTDNIGTRQASGGIVDGAIKLFSANRVYTMTKKADGSALTSELDALTAALTKLIAEEGASSISDLYISGCQVRETASPQIYEVEISLGALGASGGLRQADAQSATPTLNGREHRRRFSMSPVGITIKQSLETTGYAPSGHTPPNHGKNIGARKVDGVKTFEGMPWYDASTVFVIPVTLKASSFSDSTLQTEFDLAFLKTNSATFKGYSAGEVILAGIEGGHIPGSGEIDIEYTFWRSPNQSSIAVSADVTVTTKKGWEALEVYQESVEDTTGNDVKTQVKAAYVHRLADTYNMNNLPGIKTA